MAKMHVEATCERPPISFKVNLLMNCLSTQPALSASFFPPIYKMTQRFLVTRSKGLKWYRAWVKMPSQDSQINSAGRSRPSSVMEHEPLPPSLACR